MKSRVISVFFAVSLVVCISAWAGPSKPAPTWNGKPAEQMTAQEMKEANKALDAKIKKGDSSAVQQKADLNNAFDKTPQGVRAKKEDRLQKKKEDLAIAEKEENAMRDKETEAWCDRSALEELGNYWDSGHHWPSPPDGNIGPGGDRDRRAQKLKKEEEKARAAAEAARKKIEDLKSEIQKLIDELYVKSGDTEKMDRKPPAPSTEERPIRDAPTVQEFQAEDVIPFREMYREPVGPEQIHSDVSSAPGGSQESPQPVCPPGEKTQ